MISSFFPFIEPKLKIIRRVQLVGETFTILVRQMDTLKLIADGLSALYIAKRRGRNTWVGLTPKDGTPSDDFIERLLRSPQQAVFDGELKLLLPSGDQSATEEAKADGV